jgi:hypothetical protein
MNRFQKLVQSAGAQGASSGSYWLVSAVIALGGGGYVTYWLWPKHPLGAVIAGAVFLLVGSYDLNLAWRARKQR